MSLYDFYMFLKYIEHSSENLEFYVWYVPNTCWASCTDNHRFKNFEAGRLTAFPELPRAVTPVDTNSITDSEGSLEKPSKDEKFQGFNEKEPEAQENFDDGRSSPPDCYSLL
jgi:hypothetical protein